MKVTDYSKIANKYDKNQYRQNIKQDFKLSELIGKGVYDKYNVLDLACGTGIYLSNQMQYFNSNNINWYGLDASNKMLDVAKTKVENVKFTNGLAETMPYDSNSFDYIVNNYAFQHFTKKSEVLNEVARVLKKNGTFKIHNIAIHDMKKWWVYIYFQGAYIEDTKRFWEKELIYNELFNRGFNVNLQIKYNMRAQKISNLLAYAENRDISILTLLKDSDYEKGLEKMKYEIYKNPNATVVCDFAELFCIAEKL